MLDNANMAALNPSAEVVKGDVEYDGRVILYIIKGIRPLLISY